MLLAELWVHKNKTFKGVWGDMLLGVTVLAVMVLAITSHCGFAQAGLTLAAVLG